MTLWTQTTLAAVAASLFLTACGGGGDHEPAPTANVRVAHAAPNVPAVDVFLKTPGTANSANTRVAPGLAFPAATGYLGVAPGSYAASVALAGSLNEVIGLPAATLTADSKTSVFAIGLLGGTGAQALRLQAYADDRTPVAGQAKVRVIHLAPDAPAVDVVALGAGGTIASRLVTNLAFPNATATPLTLPPGTYTVAVVPAGASSPVLPTASGVSLTLAAGQVATVIAVGCLDTAVGPCAGGQPFALRALNDQ